MGFGPVGAGVSRVKAVLWLVQKFGSARSDQIQKTKHSILNG